MGTYGKHYTTEERSDRGDWVARFADSMEVAGATEAEALGKLVMALEAKYPQDEPTLLGQTFLWQLSAQCSECGESLFDASGVGIGELDKTVQTSLADTAGGHDGRHALESLTADLVYVRKEYPGTWSHTWETSDGDVVITIPRGKLPPGFARPGGYE